MKKAIEILMLVLMIAFLSVSDSLADVVSPPKPVRSVKQIKEENCNRVNPVSNSKSAPVLKCDKTVVNIEETFYLSWRESVDYCTLWLSVNDGEFESLGYVDSANTGYKQCFSDPGKYTYCLMTLVEGEEWKQSNFVDVQVRADEDTMCRILSSQGKNNSWNLLFMIYRNVQIGGVRKSFTDVQISAVKTQIRNMKTLLENLTDGRMRIGSVDTIVIDEPVTSVSPSGYSLPSLSYGPGKDVDFNYIFDHKDITLVAVYAPLLYLNGDVGDWLGLGGTYLTVNNKRIYNVIINEISTDNNTWTIDQIQYPTANSATVHEMLHAVETNSKTNGWSDFQPLHDYEQVGYVNTNENGNYPWYHDLTRNTIKTGKEGFLKYSFYVSHKSIPVDMVNGDHVDYDGVTRYYADGIPYRQYIWSSDNSQVTASCIQANNAMVIDPETSEVSYTVTREPGCEEAGEGTYTALFTHLEYSTQKRMIEIASLGHHWGEPSFSWRSKNSCTAIFTCDRCAKKQKINAKVKSSDQEDQTIYTATVDFEGIRYQDKITVQTKATVNGGRYELNQKGNAAVFIGPEDKKSKQLTIQDRVEIGGKSLKVTKIEDKACMKMKKLKKVIIGAGVVTIGDRAFEQCTALTEIELPSSVKNIGMQAFYKCKKLKKMKIKGTNLKSVGRNAVGSTNKKNVITVKKKKLKQYESLFRKAGLPKEGKVRGK